MKIKRVIAMVVLILGIAVGVGLLASRNKNEGSSKKLQVVGSYYPLYDFAKQVGGDFIRATNVTPAGAEPHDYEPSAKQLAEAQQAQVFIYNGGHMEPWVVNFLHDYHHVAVKSSRGIGLIEVADEESSSEQVQDPHFWLDPILAQQIVKNIRDGLSQADPAHKADYSKNASTYIAQLKQLDQDFRDGLTQCQTQTIITSHQAFSYVDKRYNLDVRAISGISPEEEPNPAKLADLSKLVADKGIKYVFFESLVSPRLADTIANGTGAQTLVFDPIEGLSDADQKQGKNYISVQHENIKNLRTALACR